MSAIRLLIDEDVRSLLAEVLRGRGYDVVAVVPAGLSGMSDSDLLEWATKHDRAILTHNVAHFLRLAEAYAQRGWEHPGIILSRRIPFRVLLARIHRLLARRQSEQIRNNVEWLESYR